ncbi:hypothetical protein QTP70_031966 [Hemibagrus guttatus]|uniref:Uncharacterized protein n=1 Tax=Hemibagrus guttatus TaxID=175788 RepID=A0AAE0UZG5_9TELE|nr:hypothetical protein QTP70_031966 [Hemibagrus guttatus]
MGKSKDLSEVDKGQIVMSRRLNQSISKNCSSCGVFLVCSAGCVCITYLGKTWHQDALWEEGKLAEEASCFGQYSAGKPAIHVDVTLIRTTYLSNVADHVHPFMETVFPDGCGLFQQDSAPCHKAKMAIYHRTPSGI